MALTGLTGIQISNLNVSGIATFEQTVGIAGTLTYEDVTNVDSVGLVTARDGIKVSGGQVLVGSGTSLHSTGLDLGTGNITGHNLKSTGIITATSFVGSGANLTGIDTDLVSDTSPQLGGDLQSNGSDIDIADNDRIYIGTDNDTQIYDNNVNTYIDSNLHKLRLQVGDNRQIILEHRSDGDYMALFKDSGSVDLYYSGSKKFETTNTGAVVTGICTATSFSGDGSALTGITQTTINNNATTKFITGTNNANELDCEANLSYNNSLVTFASSSLMVSKSTSPTISVKETAGNKEGAFRANTDGVLLRTLGNYPLIFHTNQTERAQIDGSGRFLIGTNSVYNANSYSNNLIIYENGDAGASIIGNASNSNYASLYLTDTSTAVKGYLEAQLGVNGNFTIGANGTGPIRFTNNGGERFRIGSAGQLGIGGANYGTSGQVLTSQGNSSAVQWATPSSFPSHIDIWRITQDSTLSSGNYLTSNWSRAVQSSTGDQLTALKGAQVTQSSGVFTFPTTGIWQIMFQIEIYKNGSCRWFEAGIMGTEDNFSSLRVMSTGYASLFNSGSNTHASARTSTFYKVSNVSNNKIKFRTNMSDQVTNESSTTANQTWVEFVRVSDI